MKQMRKNLVSFGILVLVLGISISPMLAVVAEIPVEVERIKDYYYFKIQGKPLTQPDGQPTENGKAEFVYKNLSLETQNIIVSIEKTIGSGYYDIELAVDPGEVVSDWRPQLLDEVISFNVYIDPDPLNSIADISEQIWIPHNTQ